MNIKGVKVRECVANGNVFDVKMDFIGNVPSQATLAKRVKEAGYELRGYGWNTRTGSYLILAKIDSQ